MQYRIRIIPVLCESYTINCSDTLRRLHCNYSSCVAALK